MFRLAGILGVLVLGGIAVLTLTPGSGSDDAVAVASSGADTSATRTKQDGTTRLDFLRGIEIDDNHALILHPMATGGQMRVVTDSDALRTAQPAAFYTDDPGEQTKILLLSILFLSPAGMPPNSQFVTTLHNKEVVEHFRCYPAFCNGTYEADPPHLRDLAGLLEASEPTESVTVTSRNPEDIRAAHFRALSDPSIVQIDPPQLPAPNTVIFPNRMILNLPAVLLETDAGETEPLEPFDEAAYLARFKAAFAHAFPQTEAYRLGELRFSTYYPPPFGWPVVSDELDGYLKTAEGELRGIRRLMLIEPTISIDLNPPMMAALQSPEAFDALPEFAREPDMLSEQLNALALEVLGRPCPECFKIELPVATVDAIKPREISPKEYALSYLKIVSP